MMIEQRAGGVYVCQVNFRQGLVYESIIFKAGTDEVGFDFS
jgi:hypothetical protein